MAGLFKSLFDRSSDPEETSAAEAQVLVSEAEPIHVTDDTFEELVLQAELPALVDFWAPWCGPCRMIAPVLEDLARAYDGRAIVAKVNTDENVVVASQLGIQGIPTLVLFAVGQETDRIVGFAPKKTLEDTLDAAIG